MVESQWHLSQTQEQDQNLTADPHSTFTVPDRPESMAATTAAGSLVVKDDQSGGGGMRKSKKVRFNETLTSVVEKEKESDEGSTKRLIESCTKRTEQLSSELLTIQDAESALEERRVAELVALEHCVAEIEKRRRASVSEIARIDSERAALLLRRQKAKNKSEAFNAAKRKWQAEFDDLAASSGSQQY